MSYLEIEQELGKIEKDLIKKLQQENIINSKGTAIKIDEFNKLLEETINKVSALLPEEGVGRYDANSANIIFARLDFLRNMKEKSNIYPYKESLNPEYSYEEKIIARMEKEEKERKEKHGKAMGDIKNFFAKLFGKKPNNNSKKR